MSILNLYKQQNIFELFFNNTELPHNFYDASFLFYTYERILYCILTIKLI